MPDDVNNPNSSAGSTPSPALDDPIARALEVAKRIEEGNKKSEILLKEQKDIAVRMMLGGRSMAGQSIPIPPTPEEIQLAEVKAFAKKAGLKIYAYEK